jgi:hypothetical protein
MKLFINSFMEKTNEQKRNLIEKSLNRDAIQYDYRSIEVIHSLIQNDKNLNDVIKHIDEYRNSPIANKTALQNWSMQKVKKYRLPQRVTLTFTDYYDCPSDIAKQRCQKFIKAMSKDIYKNAYRRHRKLIKNNIFLEGNVRGIRVHLEMIIETPEKLSSSNFQEMIQHYWVYGHAEVNLIQEQDIEQVVRYTHKLRSKEERLLQDSLVICGEKKSGPKVRNKKGKSLF